MQRDCSRSAGYACYRLKKYWHFDDAADGSRARFDAVADYLLRDIVTCRACLFELCDLCELLKILMAEGWVP